MADAQTLSEGTGHAAPVWKYVVVFAALLLLTATTVGAAFVDLGPMSDIVAVGIATIKASLVMLYFMHVRYSARMIPLVVLASMLWLFNLLGGSFGDYVTRGWLGVPGK